MDFPKPLDSESLLNSIDNGIITIDADGMIIYFNKTAERIFDIPSSKALSRFILDVLPNAGGKLLTCLRTGTPFSSEKLKGQQGTLISNINPVITNGKISGVISVFQDISEIEGISKELDLFKNTKNWLDAIIDSSYDGLWICDHEGNVVRMNKASEKINNLKAEKIIGKNVKDLMMDGLFNKAVTFEVLKRRSAVTLIQQIKSGKNILITGNPIFDEKGKITFVVINERDITVLDELRAQLQENRSLVEGYVTRLSELEMRGIDLSNVIIRSEKMQRIVEMAIRVGEVSSTVLLLGESGVGKGMIAKLIHKNSGQSNGPFMRVDCAGIPESLIESELFGYEKGAFTGAKTEGKPGFLELANRGTLFLDEIGEVPLSSQSKLLRFLEDHEITRVGGTEPKIIDLRVIAASNRNIEEMVSTKQFREDLYYRLNVIPIHIPPLRDRREDILPLVFHFLERFNRNYHKSKFLSPEVMACLCKYDFPGNIRELANIMERLVVVSEKERIGMQDLPDPLVSRTSKVLPDYFLSEGIPLKDALKKCEYAIIERAIKKYGSQRGAAKALRVDQANISRKIKRYPFLKADAISHR
jgi:PAS domain S-box-containing protein